MVAKKPLRAAAALHLTLLALVLTAVCAPGRALACPPIAGVEPLLEPGRVILLGEMHGTVESPAFVSALACRALDAGRPVAVALEIPKQEGERIERFLGSAGAEGDRAALLASEFWQEPYQDGRRSRAKLALLEDLRAWRGRGLPIAVDLIDDAAATSGAERDRHMAEAVVGAAAARPEGVVVVLTGNLHNRVTRGLPWSPEHEPMGLTASPPAAAPGRSSPDR